MKAIRSGKSDSSQMILIQISVLGHRVTAPHCSSLQHCSGNVGAGPRDEESEGELNWFSIRTVI